MARIKERERKNVNPNDLVAISVMVLFGAALMMLSCKLFGKVQANKNARY